LSVEEVRNSYKNNNKIFLEVANFKNYEKRNSDDFYKSFDRSDGENIKVIEGKSNSKEGDLSKKSSINKKVDELETYQILSQDNNLSQDSGKKNIVKDNRYNTDRVDSNYHLKNGFMKDKDNFNEDATFRGDSSKKTSGLGRTLERKAHRVGDSGNFFSSNPTTLRKRKHKSNSYMKNKSQNSKLSHISNISGGWKAQKSKSKEKKKTMTRNNKSLTNNINKKYEMVNSKWKRSNTNEKNDNHEQNKRYKEGNKK